MIVTVADLRRFAAKGKSDILAALAEAMPAVLPAFAITSPLRFCHFIAQAAHETMGFATLNELGSSAYFEKRYGATTAVARRLGNNQPGDGARYHGRGIFQLTGRTNYGLFGRKIGVDLESNPALAARPDISLRVACEYWRAKGLNALADADDIEGITRKINGGLNGLKERKAWFAKARAIWPDEPAIDAWPEKAVPLPRERPDIAPAPIVPEPELQTDVALPAPAAVPIPDPPPVDDLANSPAIATEPPKPMAQSKTLWGTVSSFLSGGGLGTSLNSLWSNPQAVWIIGAVLAFLLIGGVSLAVVFRERILKRVELGI